MGVPSDANRYGLMANPKHSRRNSDASDAGEECIERNDDTVHPWTTQSTKHRTLRREESHWQQRSDSNGRLTRGRHV
jgi:hypothetical protein